MANFKANYRVVGKNTITPKARLLFAFEGGSWHFKAQKMGTNSKTLAIKRYRSALRSDPVKIGAISELRIEKDDGSRLLFCQKCFEAGLNRVALDGVNCKSCLKNGAN
jgi:hypothetical protein